jgi:cell division transport system permease protein
MTDSALFQNRFLAHIAKSFRSHFKLQAATFTVLIAGFSVVAGVLTASDNLQRILTLWGDSMQMSVYFSENATERDISSVQSFIEMKGKFTTPKWVSKQEALESFQAQIASYAPDLLKDPELVKFIPSSLQLGVDKSVELSAHLPLLQETAAALKVFPGVDDVSFGQDWVKNCASFLQAMQVSGGAFVAILLSCAVFVMLNSISTSIHQRRAEIEVLELIGATPRYIRLPYVVEGALMGAVCSLMALTITAVGTHTLRDYLAQHVSFLQMAEHLKVLSPQTSFVFFVAGTSLGAFSAWLCVRKINTGWAASHGGSH